MNMQNDIGSNSNKPKFSLKDKLRSIKTYQRTSEEARENALVAFFWQLLTTLLALACMNNTNYLYGCYSLLIGLVVGVNHSLSIVLGIHPSKTFVYLLLFLAILSLLSGLALSLS